MKTAPSTRVAPTSRGTFLLLVFVLGYLWFVLINELRGEWTVNPQYGYGWAVPFLCAYLIWENATKRRLNIGRPATGKRHLPATFVLLLLGLGALLYLPTRWVLEANPGWRMRFNLFQIGQPQAGHGKRFGLEGAANELALDADSRK